MLRGRRPKGGIDLLPMRAEAAGFQYYYRLANFIYRNLSPGGFMFLETPRDQQNPARWGLTINDWVKELQAHNIEADSTGKAMVIKKTADRQGGLPSLGEAVISQNLETYCDRSQLKTSAWSATPSFSDQQFADFLKQEVQKRNRW